MPTTPFLLTTGQMRRLSPHFALVHGIGRVDGRRVLSGIMDVIRNGLRSSVARRVRGLRSSQDDRQPLRALEQYGRVRPHVNRRQRRPRRIRNTVIITYRIAAQGWRLNRRRLRSHPIVCFGNTISELRALSVGADSVLIHIV